MPLFAASMLFALTTQQGFTYREYELDKLPPTEFAARRQALLRELPAGSLVFATTNPQHQRSNDTNFRFRPNSDFWYLTGCEEAESALLLSPDGITVDGVTANEVLFVMDKNPGGETWTGVRMGPAVAKTHLGVRIVVSNTRFKEVLESAKATKIGAITRKVLGKL
jgi:Xaa-Pro aminopeptidase